MKIFTTSLLILLISNSFAAECVQDQVEIKEKTYKVCKTGKYGYLSESCKDVQSCFPVKGLTLKLSASQNPAFTLCEMIKGEGVSGTAKSSKAVDSFCLLNDKIIDMNQLINAR